MTIRAKINAETGTAIAPAPRLRAPFCRVCPGSSFLAAPEAGWARAPWHSGDWLTTFTEPGCAPDGAAIFKEALR